MSWIWDSILLLTVVLFILGLILRGLISTQFGALALLLLVIFRAIGRGRGGHLSRLVRMVFTLGIPITSLLIFAVAHGQGDPEQIVAIIAGLGALLLALLGFYIMVRGLFAR